MKMSCFHPDNLPQIARISQNGSWEISSYRGAGKEHLRDIFVRSAGEKIRG